MRRYRERKRSRVEALQGDIEALEEELRQLQVQQQANAALAEKNKCDTSPCISSLSSTRLPPSKTMSSSDDVPGLSKQRRSKLHVCILKW